MKRYFIKRGLGKNQIEYYSHQDGWTSDRNQADGHFKWGGAETTILHDDLHGCYISCENINI